MKSISYFESQWAVGKCFSNDYSDGNIRIECARNTGLDQDDSKEINLIRNTKVLCRTHLYCHTPCRDRSGN